MYYMLMHLYIWCLSFGKTHRKLLSFVIEVFYFASPIVFHCQNDYFGHSRACFLLPKCIPRAYKPDGKADMIFSQEYWQPICYIMF